MYAKFVWSNVKVAGKCLMSHYYKLWYLHAKTNFVLYVYLYSIYFILYSFVCTIQGRMILSYLGRSVLSVGGFVLSPTTAL